MPVILFLLTFSHRTGRGFISSETFSFHGEDYHFSMDAEEEISSSESE